MAGAESSSLTSGYTRHWRRTPHPSQPDSSVYYALLKGWAEVDPLTHTSCFRSPWMALAFARDWETHTVRTRLKADRIPGQSPPRPPWSLPDFRPASSIFIFETGSCHVDQVALELTL